MSAASILSVAPGSAFAGAFSSRHDTPVSGEDRIQIADRPEDLARRLRKMANAAG